MQRSTKRLASLTLAASLGPRLRKPSGCCASLKGFGALALPGTGRSLARLKVLQSMAIMTASAWLRFAMASSATRGCKRSCPLSQS